MVRILVVGPSGCDKYTAIRRMMPVITESNHCKYPHMQYDSYFVHVRDMSVKLIDLCEDASLENLHSACLGIDGAIVFAGQLCRKYSETISEAAPRAKIRYINYKGNADVDMPRISITNGDNLQPHIEGLIDTIREAQAKSDVVVPVKVEYPKPEPIESREMWLLSTSTDRECQMYDNLGKAHEEIDHRFTFPVQYDGAEYFGFRAQSGENHVFATRDICVAAIIKDGLARVEKATFHIK